MARPRFSEMLVDRRRQLGLSISQASSVLRLKEQVLIAFEEGDFDRIPKTGYAQGMLASYARYLGLNSRQVVNQFSEDLYEYANDPGRARATDTGYPTARGYSGTGAGPYVESRGLLPTSGGLAGDMGAFSTTSQPHSRSQSSPLVTQRRYVGTAGRSEESAVDDALSGTYADERPYTTRMPSTRTRGSQARTLSRYGTTSVDATARRSYASRDQVTTRRVPTGGYEDEYRYGGTAQSYDYDEPSAYERERQASSTRMRSRSTRQQRSGRQQRAQRRNGGVVGAVMDFFSDGRRAIPLLLAALVLALTVIVIVSVRSCVGGGQSQQTDTTVPVSSTVEGTETTDTGTGTGAGAGTGTEADAASSATTTGEGTIPAESTAEAQDTGAATTKDTTPKQTRVVVTVASGMVSWVEVQCDGESMIAETVTGPWSQAYEPHESIVVEVGDPAAVTVTENGVRRQFDQKTSGIGTVTIQGTPEIVTSTDSGGSKDTGDTEKADDADATTSQDQKKGDTGEDEMVMEYNGYDIYYHAEDDLYYFFDDDGVKHNAQDGSIIG